MSVRSISVDVTPDKEAAPTSLAKLTFDPKLPASTTGEALLSPPEISLASTTPGDEEATPSLDFGEAEPGGPKEKLETDGDRDGLQWPRPTEEEDKSLDNQDSGVLSQSTEEAVVLGAHQNPVESPDASLLRTSSSGKSSKTGNEDDLAGT